MQANVRQLHFECVAVTVRSSLSALVLVSLLLGLYVVICSWQCSSKQQVLCVGSAYQCCSYEAAFECPLHSVMSIRHCHHVLCTEIVSKVSGLY